MSPTIYFLLSDKTLIKQEKETNGTITSIYKSDLYDSNNIYVGEATIYENTLTSNNPSLVGITNLSVTLNLLLENNIYEIINLNFSHQIIDNLTNNENITINTTVISNNTIHNSVSNKNKIIYGQQKSSGVAIKAGSVSGTGGVRYYGVDWMGMLP